MNWPRYMIGKTLGDGSIAYYWNPHKSHIAAGFTLKREPLGKDYAQAIERAAQLNLHLDAWRSGRGEVKQLDLRPGYGTLNWLVEVYKQSNAWTLNVSDRSRDGYVHSLNLVLRHKGANGIEVGTIHTTKFDARAVDKLYVRLQKGPRTERRSTRPTNA